MAIDSKRAISENAQYITAVEDNDRMLLYNARTRESVPGKILSIEAIRKTNNKRMTISFLVSLFLLITAYISYKLAEWSLVTYICIGVFGGWMLIYALFVNDSAPVGLLVKLDSGVSIRMYTLEAGLLSEVSYTNHKVRMEMIQNMQEAQK